MIARAASVSLVVPPWPRAAREAFLLHVDRVGRGCWPWAGRRTPKGYGRFWHGGKWHLAHRVAFEIGDDQQIPRGLLVLHRCELLACVRFEHLRLANEPPPRRAAGLSATVVEDLRHELADRLRLGEGRSKAIRTIADAAGITEKRAWGLTRNVIPTAEVVRRPRTAEQLSLMLRERPIQGTGRTLI